MSPDFETFDDFIAGARRGARLTNSTTTRTPMTRSRLQALILQGFGQGRNDDYVPWIRVTRGNAPRMSNHLVAKLSCQETELHLMSSLEYGAARVASWLGAKEVRSQLPLFPWSGHPHPLAGLSASVDAQLPPTKGLLEIAKQACIKHGTFTGAPDLPYVATTDLVVRLGPAACQQLMFWTVKPAALIRQQTKGSRMLQRIELERLYAEAIGATHVLYDGSAVSAELLQNLDWLEPPRRERIDESEVASRAGFVNRFKRRPDSEPLRERIENAATEAGLDCCEGMRHFRAAAWLTEIDIDLTRPVLMSHPMTMGGAVAKEALFNLLTEIRP